LLKAFSSMFQKAPDTQQEQEQKPKDVKLIPLADFHSGGSTALFPYYDGTDLGFPPHRNMTGRNGGWKFRHMIYEPSGKQLAMFRHLTKCAEQIAESRNDNRFIIVQTGDSIEGTHHHTPQLATRQLSEQVAIHVWLMKYFMFKIGFDKNKGDLLFVGDGTEIHDADEEGTLAQQLDAELLPDGSETFDFLPMDINSKRFWFLHQGAGAGKGISSGEALRNWIKNQYFSCLEEKRVIPDCVISGHFHRSVHTSYSRLDREIHGVILPPFQLKTRFGYRVAAAELEGVGIRTIDISEDGVIKVNKPMLLQSQDDVVTI
jgi:hypothetical protein